VTIWSLNLSRPSAYSFTVGKSLDKLLGKLLDMQMPRDSITTAQTSAFTRSMFSAARAATSSPNIPLCALLRPGDGGGQQGDGGEQP
jgi:hypothetical protein